jgi:hypothetical protein
VCAVWGGGVVHECGGEVRVCVQYNLIREIKQQFIIFRLAFNEGRLNKTVPQDV